MKAKLSNLFCVYSTVNDVLWLIQPIHKKQERKVLHALQDIAQQKPWYQISENSINEVSRPYRSSILLLCENDRLPGKQDRVNFFAPGLEAFAVLDIGSRILCSVSLPKTSANSHRKESFANTKAIETHMQIAVISDIHSNYMALENALCMIDRLKPDGMIFLGDYLTDFPYPQRTLYLLDQCRSAFPCWFVRGNREDYMLRHRENPDDGWRHSSSSGSLLYTFENLAKCDLDWFGAMPSHLDVFPDKELGFEGVPPITACHGSPRATKEWIMNRPALIDHYLEEITGKVLLCGHTHRAGVAEGHGKRLIFCPSIGLPHDVNPGAKFLMLEPRSGVWRYRTYIVDYDKRRMEREFYKSGLVAKSGIWAKCIIRDMYEERDNAARCVALAWRIAASERFDGSSVLPEEYWERAARELRLI